MRKPMSFAIGLGMLSIYAATPARAGDNLLKDGGFEKPAPPIGSYTVYDLGQRIGPWTVFGPSGNVAVVSNTFLNAKAGKAYLDLTGVCDCGAATGVAQTIATTIGQKYQLTFWLGYDQAYSSSGTSSVLAYANSNLLVTAVNSTGNPTMQTWKRFRVSFVAETASTTISFVNASPNPDADTGLDSVSLVAD